MWGIPTIELSYVLAFFVLILVSIAFYLDRLNWFIALVSGAMALFIGYIVSLYGYTDIIVEPLKNSLFYGFEWGYLEIFILANYIMIILMCTLALYYLWITKGRKLWG